MAGSSGAAAPRRSGPGAGPLRARVPRRLDIPAGAREAILARVEISSANSAERVAAAELAGVAHIDDEPAPSIAGGNQRLPLALADSLGAAVRLDSPVQRSRVGRARARPRRDGELDADVCVIAVPASVLDRIAFDPALPEPDRRAARPSTYGHAAKLFVPLQRPAEPSAVMNVPERYWTWTATGDGDRPQPVVSAFAGSEPALDALEVEAGPGRWLDSLERLRGDLDAGPRRRAPLHLGRRPLGPAPPTPPRRRRRGRGGRASPPARSPSPASTPPARYAALMEGAIRSGRRAARSLCAGRA